MNRLQKTILILCSVFLFSCAEDTIENVKTVEKPSVSNLTSGPVLDRILSLGYTGNDILEYDDYFLVDGDIRFPKNDTVAVEKSLLRQSSVSTVPLTRRTIRIKFERTEFWTNHQDMAYNGLVQAISKFNNVNSSLFFVLEENLLAPIATENIKADVISKITIHGNLNVGLSSADYPNGVYAGGTINVNETMLSNEQDLSYLTYQSIFMHSLGHCIGLKNSGDTDGIPINGTPSSEYYSIMNSDFIGITNSFTSNDKVAILALYPSDVKGAFDLEHKSDLAIGFDYNAVGYENLMFYRPGNYYERPNIFAIYDWFPQCSYLNIAQSNGTFITKNVSYNGLGYYDLKDENDRMIALDCDGDGVDELFCYRPGKKTVFLLKYNTSTGLFSDLIESFNGVGGYNFDNVNDKAIALDYNGDNIEELLCYRPGSGVVFILKYDKILKAFNLVKEYRSGIGSFDLKSTQDKIIKLRYNNDSYEDLMCYRPGRGVVYIMTSNGNGTFTLVSTSTTGLSNFNFNSELDRAVVMNYNNDQYDDIVCYRPGSRFIHFKKGNGTKNYETVYVSTNGAANFDLSSVNDKIVSLDYNRKPSNRIVLYRSGGGVAYSAHFDGTTFVRDTPPNR